MEFTKILLAKNQAGIDSQVNQLNYVKDYFQECITQLEAIGITIGENDLEVLFSNPKAYITDKLTDGKDFRLGGLNINKEKAFDLIEKPAGTNELIEKIEIDKQKEDTNLHIIWKANHFKVVNNVVSVADSILQRYEAMFSLYIESQEQQNGLNKITELVNLINEINLTAKQKIGLTTELSDIMKYNGNSFEVINNCVKRFN